MGNRPLLFFTHRELAEDIYKAYIQEGGERLIKASDEELAKNVAEGKGATFLVSYYRLIGRNEKLAQDALQKATEILCASDTGEGWSSLLIAGFGRDVTDTLFKIVDTGTDEQRRIAINALGLMRDPNVVDILLEFFSKDAKKFDNVSYLSIARAAITVGNPKGMELLIEPATGKKENDIQRTCRAELERTLERYDDMPSDWSAENWNEWWQKHKDRWKPEENGQSQQLLLQSVKSNNKVCQEVAQRIEKELKNG